MPSRAFIAFIELAIPEEPKTSHLDESQSWLLSGLSIWADHRVYGFFVGGRQKSEDLGRIFSHIPPSSKGTFEIELGATLPDLLPNLSGQLDYAVNIRLPGEPPRSLAVSNQMARLNCVRDGKAFHVLTPRHRLSHLENNETFQVPPNTPSQLLRTTVTSRFTISGHDAEEALELAIEQCIEKFLSLLNHFLASIQMIEDGPHCRFSQTFDVLSLASVYLIIKGDESGPFGNGILATHAGRLALNPPSIEGQKKEELLAYLSGEEQTDPIRLMISAARSSFESGLLQFSLLQMVIATEMATSKYIRSRFLALGVSRSKWDKAENDITYSQMLNVHLFVVAPDKLKPDRDLIGKLNRARELRNNFMHRGEFALQRDEALELLNTTERYLNYLKQLS